MPLIGAALLLGCGDASLPADADDDSPAVDGDAQDNERDGAPADAGSDERDDESDDDDGAPTPPPRDSSTHDGGAPDSRTRGGDDEAGIRAPGDSGTPKPRDAAIPELPDLLDGAAPALPDLFGDGGLFAPKIPGPPSPDNPKECPPVAPDNPIGSCIGVPVYATCTYGTYSCLCDWVHWLCI